MIFTLWEDSPITLQIQHEMVDLRLSLGNTSAGRVLGGYVKEEQRSYEKELEKLSIPTEDVQLRVGNRAQP